MKRREFLQKLIAGFSTVPVGIWWLAKKASTPKFVRAVRVREYPGPLRPLGDISKQGKWSG